MTKMRRERSRRVWRDGGKSALAASAFEAWSFCWRITTRGGFAMINQLRRGMFVSLLSVLFLVPLLPGISEAQQATQPALQAIKSRGELKVGWATFFPYVYRDTKTKEITGFAADFMKVMADSMGVKLVWVE